MSRILTDGSIYLPEMVEFDDALKRVQMVLHVDEDNVRDFVEGTLADDFNTALCQSFNDLNSEQEKQFSKVVIETLGHVVSPFYLRAQKAMAVRVDDGGESDPLFLMQLAAEVQRKLKEISVHLSCTVLDVKSPPYEKPSRKFMLD